MKAKRIVRGVLLAFVLVSIGFAIGREATLRAVRPSGLPAEGGDKVVVYYMHTTWRCATCNRVESTAEALIRSEFAAPLRDGRLEWASVDFQRNEELAERYEVGGNMIVVVRFKDGKEVDRRRLADVMDLAVVGEWGLIEDRTREAVRDCLAGGAA